MLGFLLFFVLVFLETNSCLAQKEATNWYFGNKAGLSFKYGFAEKLTDGKLYTWEGCSVISDKKTGELLFYTDGVTIWNKYHKVMEDGTGLKSGLSSTQNSLIVPNPLVEYLYYVFTVPDLTYYSGPSSSRLFYSEVDLKKPEGIVLRKNIPLIDSISERITGTINCEDGGYWILTHHRKKAIFYAYRIKENVNPIPVITDFNETFTNASAGHLKFSSDGSKIAMGVNVADAYTANSMLYLFDFNMSTGKVENRRKIDAQPLGNIHDAQFYGVSFSPDNTILYATGLKCLYQYDISLSTENEINKSRIEIAKGYYCTLQTGPNRKIYVTRQNETGHNISIIHNPNKRGTECNLLDNQIEIPTIWSLPNFMEYIFAENYVGNCFTNFSSLENISICSGIEFTLKHNNSKNVSQRTWFIENTTILSETDSIIKGIITKVGEHKVRLVYKIKDLTDTLYCVISVTSEKPKANAGRDLSFCLTKDSLSTVIGSPSVGGYSYSWSPTTGLDNPFSSYPIATLAESRQYILTVTNKEGCVNYDTVLISIVKNDVKTNGDVSICKGQSVQLSATGSISYQWEPTSSLLYPNSDRPIATPTITTTYKVIGDNGFCKDSAFVTVSVDDYPVATAGDDQKTCPRIPVSLGSPPIDGLEYSWSPPLYLNNPNSSQPECTPLDNVRYILSVRNKTGCTSYDTVDVITGGALPLSVSDDKTLCSGDQVQLSAQGADSYLWTPHDGLQDTTSPNPIASPSQTTMYYVTGFKGDCFAKDSVLVTVFPKPNVRVVPADTVICAGEGVLLTAFGADSYRWSPATGLESPNEHQTIAKPAVTTEYVVEGSTNGCTTSQKTTVHVLNNESVAILPTLRTDQHFRPGDIVPFPFTIPSRLSQVRFTITFDTCCIVFHSLNSDNVSSTISQHNDSSVTITVLNPERQNGMVNVQFMPLLPPDKRLQEKLSVIVNEFASVCAHVYGGETEIFYDPGCAWNLRGIQTTDKFSILPIANNRAVLHTGIGGLITVSIYDMTGNEVWRMKDTYPSSTEENITLPELASGVFILRAQNYGWKSDVIVIK